MTTPRRVSYRERQRLRSSDLRAGQDYLLGLAGRHHVGPHEWGIVRGLGLSVENGVATIRAGLAIDGNGRELVVAQETAATLIENVDRQYVYLHYCERPQGACGDDAPNTRWLDSAEITIRTDLWLVPEPEPELSHARAAGSLNDARPWPVLLGIVEKKEGKLFVTVAESRFAGARAAQVASPSGRALMRTGRKSLADPYHFHVQSQATGGGLQDRFAVDRDGNFFVWGNLLLTSTIRSVTIASPIPGVYIKAEVKAGVGADVRWQADISSVEREQVLNLTFRARESGSRKVLVEEKVSLRSSLKRVGDLTVALKKFNESSRLVSLVKIGVIDQELAKERKAAARRAAMAAPAATEATTTTEATAATAEALEPIADDRDLAVEYIGAVLGFEREAGAETSHCGGCFEQPEKTSALPEGLVFQPGATAPALTSRDIYCVRVSAAGETPVEQLRVGGGVFKEGDLRRRVVVGDSRKEGVSYKFRPWLILNGNKSIEIPGGQRHKDSGKPYTMLKATGTVELPPVNPSPRDPLFNYLSTQAFLTGVLSLSSALLKITFLIPPPAFIETAQDWSYKLMLENLSLTESLAAVSNSETITGDKTAAFLRTIGNLPPKLEVKNSATVKVSHTPQDIPPGASQVTLDVKVAMRAGSLTVGSKATSVEIPVRKSPSINLDELTDPITVGASFHPAIRNESDKTLTLTEITVDVLGVQLPSELPAPPRIEPGATATAGAIRIPAAFGGASATFKVTVKYHWDDAVNPVSVIESKTVNINVSPGLLPGGDKP